MKKPIAVLLIAALAAGGWYYYQQQQKSPLPDSITYSNGRLELNRLDIASLYPGRIKAMPVDEGSIVILS